MIDDEPLVVVQNEQSHQADDRGQGIAYVLCQN